MKSLLRVYSLVSRPVCAAKAARYRNGRKTAVRVPLPVLSVGNLALGGSGKTPLALEIIGRFFSRGLRPALVTRGYRGAWERTGGVLSDGRDLLGGVREAGDEPVLVARRFPRAGVFVGRHRVPSCLKAGDLGFDLCVLDDGFQHLGLARDLDIVLHDPESRAPLREGEAALARADILLLPRPAGPEAAGSFRRRFPRLAVFDYAVTPRGLFSADGRPAGPAEALRGKRVLAFAGIARPERFFVLLETLGASVIGRLAFPDHFAYPAAARDRIAAAAARTRPDMIVTTEKDAVKIDGPRPVPIGPPLSVLRVGLDLPDAFFESLEAAVSARRSGRG